MANTTYAVMRLESEFKACQKVLTAHGDETRQLLICAMLKSECSGHRVIDIARKTSLSRPAVSHHMQILREAGIVKIRKEGTCIYYYLDPEGSQLSALITLFSDVREFMKHVPDRSGDNDDHAF